MCILFIYVNGDASEGSYKLIIASNRDEYYARPALPAAAWKKWPYVFGGQDLEPGREGGTWLAIGTKDGVTRFGAILNLTGEVRLPDASGRGFLINNYVTSDLSNEEYCKSLLSTEEKFNAYNLVTIELRERNAAIIHCSNYPSTLQKWPEKKALVFGNSSPSVPLAKVKAAQLRFEQIVHNDAAVVNEKQSLVENLMDMLKSPKKFWPDKELERRAPGWGEQLSSVFVKMPAVGYGSRTHSVILIDANNKMDYYEETMSSTDPDGPWKTTHIERQL